MRKKTALAVLKSNIYSKSPRNENAIFLFSLSAFAVLGCGFLYFLHTHNQDKLESLFQTNLSEIQEQVISRTTLYQYGIRGARGAVVAVGFKNLTRDIFLQYSATRDITQEFPGARGFGIIEKTAESDIPFLEQKLSKEYGQAIHMQSLGRNQGDRYVIRYIEPLKDNQQAVGLDIASEENRKNAAVRAMDTGLASLTAPILPPCKHPATLIVPF